MSSVASTILVEFSISTDRFKLGELIAHQPALEAELERVVPTKDHAIPYVWVRGSQEALADLKESLTQSDTTESVTILDRIAGETPDAYQQLYRIEWIIGELDILRGIIEADGAVLEGRSTDGYWFLRFRFPDHSHVAQFYQYLTTHDITDFQIESIHELTSRENSGRSHGLTSKQREAVVLAAERGYFETPREVTLEELAAELDITEQALSQRLRHATKKVLSSALNLPDEPS